LTKQPLPPIAAPPEWRGTPTEWTEARARIIASTAAHAAKTGGNAAAAAVLGEDADCTYRAAIEAAELRRIKARFPVKKDR
jgi:hypothetical protein